MVVIEDQGIVRAVLAGKGDSYQRLMEKYQGRVAVTITGVIGPRPEVEDLTQETCLLYTSFQAALLLTMPR